MPQLLTSLTDFPAELRGGAISVGNFDGVHRGHAQLIGQLVATARKHSGLALVMTFDPPPTALLFPERVLTAPLTSIARRAELLFGLGVDALIAYPTDACLLSMSAHDFFEQKILGILQSSAMVEGPNFRFGRGRDGDVESLARMCAAAGVDFQVARPSADETGLISSTRIRNYLVAGDIRAANSLLTQPYTLTGVVAQGAQRGRQIGFPTANLTHIPSLIPGPGVYVGQVSCLDRAAGAKIPYQAAIHIGPNPTFDESQTKVEVHLIGYAGESLYGQAMQVTMLDKVREVRKFDSIDELRAQIASDVAACKAMR
ncbi:MAG: riboflavin biosynthesis protein RibF [Pirellulaceae bacterium]|jgi:riboflavin kinase/FMN adenylyltransferase|nr:riboflavin biosynthesis protein RibF [Pirellulaceae bacterium]